MTDGQPTAADTPGRLMAAEIAEQPAVFDRILAESLTDVRGVATRIRDAKPRFVVVAGRGTSDHAALYFKYLVEIVLGLPGGLASPSTTTAYGADPDLRDVLWVAVSQSGGSPDLLESTRAAGRAGALTLAVTNNPQSALAAAAELHLDVRAGLERAVAATKTYTATLLTLWLLVDEWSGRHRLDGPALVDAAEQAVHVAGVTQVAGHYRFVDKLVVTGRGYAYPTAREAALKLMETSYLAAHAFSGADLLHGPLAMVDSDRPVLAVVPHGVAGHAMGAVLERLRDRGADLTVVGDAESAGQVPAIVLPRVAEELSPLIEIIPMQRLAHTMAIARHEDPDAPRGLSKVTRTT
ncbi:SIS domain-containing protein [Knoellia sp. Soil729]|uniref:SIS domain-containing protein n=1 Tax=Knoellia sp. Soil729 TaxID=1736394 RepID=UPI000701FC8D|nr:SIS domain-containing protein [Knoellia sp. Soil729]KRE42505.1 glucosamine-6-phosphate deaminase [Knoellia sp. Soil729]